MGKAESIGDPKQREADLRAAAAHLNRRELAQAQRILSPLLDRNPSDADVLQLLGVLRRMEERYEESEHFFRQSLDVDATQPGVWSALGNLLKLQFRLDEAADAYREAIRLKPNFAEAHLDLALTLSDKGDHAGAEQACRQALRLQPNYVLAKQTLAAELNDLGRPQEAERLLRQALAMGSRNPRQIAALEHNLGVSLKSQRRYDQAINLFSAARTKVPDMPFVDYNTGDALVHLGRLNEAVDAFSRAIRLNPLDIAAHDDLNKVLYRLGDNENFLKSYDEAGALYPEVGMFPLKKANLLFIKGDYEAAREPFELAAKLMPQVSAPRLGLAIVLARLNEFDAAIREHEAVAAMDPESAQSWRNFAETLLRAGDPARARDVAAKAIALEPQNQSALATWTVALRLLNDPSEERVNDYGRYVREYELPPPQGYSDMASFNRDLNTYLDRLHFGKREFIDQTLRTGTQTLGQLFGTGHAPVELLRARIDEAVADYIAQMEADADHPLTARKSPAFGYAGSWSARLHDCGFHTNHVHPQGWISSAYYVAVPDAVTDTKQDEGWIKFGEPNFECGLGDAVRRKVQPKVGHLVLFPSYMWHGTVPFHSAQSRTSVAFDVVPNAR